MKKNLTSFFKKTLGITLSVLSLLSVCSTAGLAEDNAVMSEDLALGQKTVANNAYGAQPQSYAVDGDRVTFWRTLSGCKDKFGWLMVTFEDKADINLVYLKPYGYQLMNSVKIQYTEDEKPSASSVWKDAKTFKKDEISPTMIADFDDIRATAIRFYADVSGHSVGLYTLEAYYADDMEAAIDKLNNPEPLKYREFTMGEYVDAKIVSVGEDGELIYQPYDQNGSTLMDFSYVGYKRGEAPIPDAKVVKTLEPGDLSNHTALIQNAINEVAALPLEKRGAILLKAGTYTVTAQLKIAASGIVLRGEGQGENGTVIYDARKKQDTTLHILGSDSYVAIPGTESTLTDDLVTVGKTKLTLSSVDAYGAGDTVAVTCTPNDLWVQTLGMDKIPGSTSVQWVPSEYVVTYERVVMAVDKDQNTVTLDTSIPLTLDSRYYSVTVEKIKDSVGRVTDSGVENLRFTSYFNKSLTDANGNFNDENHGWNAIRIANARDCFVRNFSAKYYGLSAVTVATGAINVTVEGCSYLSPVSDITGGRRYSFNVNRGQYTLVKNCYSYDSRHDYVMGGSLVAGPNVFLCSVADESDTVSEPHNRWSTGILFDNVYQIGAAKLGFLQAINRGQSGTGHGWAGANVLFWNSLSPGVIVGKPQTEQNFAVGAYGIYDVNKDSYIHTYKNYFVKPSIETPDYPSAKSYDGSPMHGNGYIEAPYNPVNPSSLYKAQLSYRLYGDATKNVTPNAPILETPAYDSTHGAYTVTFEGVADMLAEDVFVYVNGEKHRATLADDGTQTFSLALDLENGYYDVYVTQTINGTEGDKNATRTIFVDAKEPYVPGDNKTEDTDKPEDNEETKEPQETSDTAKTETTPQGGDGKQENPKKSYALPAAIAIGLALVGTLSAVLIKKSKKSK